MMQRFLEYYRHIESKYTLLLISLLILIIGAPFIQHLTITKIMTAVWYNLIILLTVIALRDKKHNIIAFTILAGANIMTTTLDIIYSFNWVSTLNYLLFTIYCISAVIAIYFEIASTKTNITTDTIFGALSNYLLIGISFATLYSLIQHLSPGSFIFTATQQPVTESYDMFYYSFITLTTLGYGDIIPTNLHAKPLVIIESITGIFYLATLVAQLISSRK